MEATLPAFCGWNMGCDRIPSSFKAGPCRRRGSTARFYRRKLCSRNAAYTTLPTRFSGTSRGLWKTPYVLTNTQWRQCKNGGMLQGGQHYRLLRHHTAEMQGLGVETFIYVPFVTTSSSELHATRVGMICAYRAGCVPNANPSPRHYTQQIVPGFRTIARWPCAPGTGSSW